MKVDMSPEAITRRLKLTSELRDLCIALGGERLKKRLAKERAKRRETPTDTKSLEIEETGRMKQ